MKIAIIDDERYWIEKTKKEIIKHYNNKKIPQIDVYENEYEYLIKKERYDILFIDVEMPQKNGFIIISESRKYNPNGIYIILTCHNELIREGYIVRAFRYMDKGNLSEEIKEGLEAVDILLKKDRKIELNVIGRGVQIIKLRDILYVETEKHGVIFHTKHGEKRCGMSMNETEKKLDNGCFFRCHKSFIINLDEIEKVEGTIAYMTDGSDLDISKRKIWEFNRLYIQRKYECANG